MGGSGVTSLLVSDVVQANPIYRLAWPSRKENGHHMKKNMEQETETGILLRFQGFRVLIGILQLLQSGGSTQPIPKTPLLQ